MSCTSSPPTSFTAANMSPCIFSAISHVGARLIVASMAKTRRPRSPVATGVAAFIFAMNAATSASEDASRAGTPVPDGVVAGGWRVSAVGGNRCGAGRLTGDHYSSPVDEPFAYSMAIVAAPRNIPVRLQRPVIVAVSQAAPGSRRSRSRRSTARVRLRKRTAYWGRPPWVRCPTGPRRRRAARRRRRRPDCG